MILAVDEAFGLAASHMVALRGATIYGYKFWPPKSLAPRAQEMYANAQQQGVAETTPRFLIRRDASPDLNQ